MRKSMNTRINHAHMRNKTCTKNEQNMNRCVPGRQSRMRWESSFLAENEQADSSLLLLCSSLSLSFSHPPPLSSTILLSSSPPTLTFLSSPLLCSLPKAPLKRPDHPLHAAAFPSQITAKNDFCLIPWWHVSTPDWPSRASMMANQRVTRGQMCCSRSSPTWGVYKYAPLR